MVTSSCVALLSMHISLFNGLTAASFYELPIHPQGHRASSSKPPGICIVCNVPGIPTHIGVYTDSIHELNYPVLVCW
jgi:hypothetical protein